MGATQGLIYSALELPVFPHKSEKFNEKVKALSSFIEIQAVGLGCELFIKPLTRKTMCEKKKKIL